MTGALASRVGGGDDCHLPALHVCHPPHSLHGETESYGPNCVPANPSVEALTPNMTVFGDGTFFFFNI